MCFGSYSQLGDAISQLKVGDEVSVSSTDGTNTTAIVIAIAGFSGLLHDGTIISCRHTVMIEKTGRHLEQGEYEVSELAHQIQAEAEAVQRRWAAELETDPDPLELL